MEEGVVKSSVWGRAIPLSCETKEGSNPQGGLFSLFWIEREGDRDPESE